MQHSIDFGQAMRCKCGVTYEMLSSTPLTTEHKINWDFADNVYQRCLLCGKLTVAQEACEGRKEQVLPGRHVTQDMMTC